MPRKAKVNLPVSVKEQLANEAAIIASRIGAPSGDKIKITQSKTFRLPDGSESAGPIHGIIIDFVSANYMFEGVYDPNDIEPPICSSVGLEPTSLVPFAKSPKVQSATCAGCPQNAFGSAARGRGKACQNTRLLYLIAPDATADTAGMMIKVSPTGLRGFDGYVSSIARSFQCPPIGVLTEISLDPNADYPSLRFGNPQPLTKEQLAEAMSRKDLARERLLAEPDFTSAAVAAKATKGAAGKSKRRAA